MGSRLPLDAGGSVPAGEGGCAVDPGFFSAYTVPPRQTSSPNSHRRGRETSARNLDFDLVGLSDPERDRHNFVVCVERFIKDVAIIATGSSSGSKDATVDQDLTIFLVSIDSKSFRRWHLGRRSCPR